MDAKQAWTKLWIQLRGIVSDQLVILALRACDRRDEAWPPLARMVRAYFQFRLDDRANRASKVAEESR